jgi:hypothetical protein
VESIRELVGLDEDRVWRELAPELDLEEQPAARDVFTEMLNNAIDHNDGTRAQIRVWRSTAALVIEIRQRHRRVPRLVEGLPATPQQEPYGGGRPVFVRGLR